MLQGTANRGAKTHSILLANILVRFQIYKRVSKVAEEITGGLTMEERKYKVLIENTVVAENMAIRTATILLRALFEEFYNDHTMVISIREEDRTVCAED